MVTHGADSIQRIASLGLLVTVLAIFWILQKCFRGPLAAIPGPWYSRFTDIVLKYYIFTGRRIHYIHQLHQKYGSVVRVSPNEVEVSDLAAYREVHRIGSGFVKAPWYDTFTPGMESNVFSMTNVHEHAARRRLLARPFRRSSLLTHFQRLVTERTRFAVAKIVQEANQGDCDVMKWWTLMTTDIIMEVAFGEKAGLLEAGEKNNYMKDLERTELSFSLQGETPWLYRFLKVVNPGAYRGIDQSLVNVIAKATESARKAKEGKLSPHNILSGMIEASRLEGTVVNDFGLGSQASALVIAGSGTTSATLTYATWVLLKHPAVRQKLEDELIRLPDDFDDVKLEGLPYLTTFVTEVLRVYGSAPGALPRTTPSHGIQIGDYRIPPGVTLTTQAYTMHRDPSIFENPETYVKLLILLHCLNSLAKNFRFDPDRFYKRDLTTDQKHAFTPFGGGTRVCLGIHLAYMEIRHGTAEFVRNCRHLKLSRLTTPESMEMENFFLIAPKGHRLMVESSVKTES
ncbi:hypothetical protein LTR70_010145 [Exophiala xenobiotica]|uniref:Cytochrome P450 n=1 Tax=Lithohypha guttulata TaxID=1690604 RepID=A0ABR0JUY5_9EURO|nr:hypothetical protein LTR24_010102 [Lithohypha guttulata]KAK5309604.1 hypothetical protein LTR70_010145 [Exophiala xenobiotica]